MSILSVLSAVDVMILQTGNTILQTVPTSLTHRLEGFDKLENRPELQRPIRHLTCLLFAQPSPAMTDNPLSSPALQSCRAAASSPLGLEDWRMVWSGEVVTQQEYHHRSPLSSLVQ